MCLLGFILNYPICLINVPKINFQNNISFAFNFRKTMFCDVEAKILQNSSISCCKWECKQANGKICCKVSVIYNFTAFIVSLLAFPGPIIESKGIVCRTLLRAVVSVVIPYKMLFFWRFMWIYVYKFFFFLNVIRWAASDNWTLFLAKIGPAFFE